MSYLNINYVLSFKRRTNKTKDLKNDNCCVRFEKQQLLGERKVKITCGTDVRLIAAEENCQPPVRVRVWVRVRIRLGGNFSWWQLF